MMRRLRAWCGAGCLWAALLVPAQAQDPAQAKALHIDPSAAGLASDAVPERLAQERHALALQKDAILQAYEKQMAACWQKFAVNACLLEARRQRRQAMDPVTQQELALNAQERAWRTEQRERRLQDKPAAPGSAP